MDKDICSHDYTWPLLKFSQKTAIPGKRAGRPAAENGGSAQILPLGGDN